ncbi:DNA glycosylase AlkZ-like family protein [Planosporangium sp. 12N6]|uniref:DNA glycosylase AlkZ-like family protein n=1 Tax=Planosporangium spinosum TaxID=3402278 RepID=UPI003CEB682A
MDARSRMAWWWRRQGLDGSLATAAPAVVLAATGWARSVGGANPYLTLFARAGTGRADADAAVRALDLHELPAARGCTYVVPAAHFALALQVGRGVAEGELATLAKLGVARGEVDKLCDAVLEVVGTEPLDPAALKDRLGDAVRNLGEEGRKRGQSTTLPAALGLLQAAGEIRRVPVNGRLDQQRYGYVRWSAPRTGLTDEQARAELARLYFRWTGPAGLAHLRWFTGFTVAAAKAAVVDLELVDVGEGLLLPADLRDEYAAHRVPERPAYALLAGIDALVLLRRDHRALLDAGDVERATPGGRPLGGLADLPDHPIVDRGRIVGLWQYDPGEERIVWWSFGPPEDEVALRAAVGRTEEYVRDQLGDARGFSLDSPKSRAPRLAALRAAAAAS